LGKPLRDLSLLLQSRSAETSHVRSSLQTYALDAEGTVWPFMYMSKVQSVIYHSLNSANIPMSILASNMVGERTTPFVLQLYRTGHKRPPTI